MTYKTVEGVLQPDGKMILPPEAIPARAVRVMVTILEDTEDSSLTEVGDYLTQLTDYEEQLARGEIRWQ